MSDSDTLGGLVRRRRLESGYSLGQLAFKVGKTAAEVRAWERDSELPEHGILERLAETLELDLADIQSQVAAAQSAAKKKPATATAKKARAAKRQAPATDKDTAQKGGEPAADEVEKPASKKKPAAKRKMPPAKADKVAEADKAAEGEGKTATAEVKKPAPKKKPASKKPAAQKRKAGAAAGAAAAAAAAGSAAAAGAAAGSAQETAGKAVAAAGAGATKTTDVKAKKPPPKKEPAPKKKPAAKGAKPVEVEEPVEQAKAGPDEAAKATKPDDIEPDAATLKKDESVVGELSDTSAAEIFEEPGAENLPGFAVDDPFTPPPVEEVDPGLLDAPTEAVPVPVITETAAAARAQRAAAVLEAPPPPPPLPTVEPAPDADPGLLRYLEPLRLLYDPQSRYLYWIRAALTVVVMMILAVVFFRMLGDLLDAISQLLDTIEPSAPSPDDLDALGSARRVLG